MRENYALVIYHDLQLYIAMQCTCFSYYNLNGWHMGESRGHSFWSGLVAILCEGWRLAHLGGLHKWLFVIAVGLFPVRVGLEKSPTLIEKSKGWRLAHLGGLDKWLFRRVRSWPRLR